MSTSRRQKPYADPTGRFARVLERHEGRIARHTAIQSNIAAIQLLFGVITTGLLIYVAVLQFQAADRQATIADRQSKLEYAKVAPQFAISTTMLPTVRSGAVQYAFPKQLQLRILRGEASIDKVEVAQEIEIAHVYDLNDRSVHDNCVVRLTDYFDRKPASWTDWVVSQTFQKLPSDPAWHQDETLRDFVILEPQNTLVTVWFLDLFGERRQLRFAGIDGNIGQIPSGDYAKSNLFETVYAHVVGGRIRIPGSFRLLGPEPKSRGCRSVFGLPGGKAE